MSSKLWGSAFTQSADASLEEFWGSIRFDQRLADVDIQGSIAHARMLGKTGIITKHEADQIIAGLEGILTDIMAGTITFNPQDEDIHMNIERILHDRIGTVAGKLHTARSRNDQVVTDMHLFVRGAAQKTKGLLGDLIASLIQQAEENVDSIMPGYTHLQRAQPVTFAHHLLAYGWMFARDIARMDQVIKSTSLCPLGSGALAGTPFPIDRFMTAQELGFDAPYPNSMDAVSNRDYVLELLMANSLVAMHLSRLCEDVILWVSSEFGFVRLSDAYSTGSSMMPQKKNADLAELVRGKTGRVYGDLFTLLTVMKGVPMTYNKDFQEDKECLFDSVDTVQNSLIHIAGMVNTMEARPDRMIAATKEGFLNATDVADYLAAKGVPFREAHEVAAKLVAYGIGARQTLNDLPIEVFQAYHPAFTPDIYEAIDIRTVLARRASYGGPAPAQVQAQIESLKADANETAASTI